MIIMYDHHTWSSYVMIMYDQVKNLVQLGEGNHRYAATRILNKQLQGKGKYYSTIPAYVQSSPIHNTSATHQDNLNSILWQKDLLFQMLKQRLKS